MNTMKSLILAAAVAAISLGAASAQAAEYRTHGPVPAAYRPSCSEPAYGMQYGYRANGYRAAGGYAYGAERGPVRYELQHGRDAYRHGDPGRARYRR